MLTPLLVQKCFHVFSEKHKKNSLFKFDLCHWVKKKKRKKILYIKQGVCMTAETFYGLKAGTLQLPGELGLCGYSSGAVMRLRRTD